MPQLITNFYYRPEIDGLRAIAVLAVVFYHAELGVTGGFTGVDVFFVISGFLITSLILKDLERNTFSITKFWERRARRIIPAMALVIIATLLAGWFLLLPRDYVNLGQSAAWQAIFSANFYFWKHSGYFALESNQQPLLHTWSLAVEEQYYLFVPLFFIGLFRLRAFRKSKYMLLLVGFGIVLSLFASIYSVERHPAAAFYLLPMRAWELLSGAFVALIPVAWLPKSRFSREIFSLMGIVAIVAPFWLYSKTTPFPGLAAVPPCIGTAMFIWACNRSDSSNRSHAPIVCRILSTRPIVFIGLISYSLYLWHWPLFAFSNYWALQPRHILSSLAFVGISGILAILTWRYIETPFRQHNYFKSMSTSAFGLISVIAVAIFSLIIALESGFPSRFSREAIEYANSSQDRLGIYELSSSEVRDNALIRIGVSNPLAPITLLLWGDSHAMAAAPAFDLYLKMNRMAGYQATASATAPILEGYWRNQYTNQDEVLEFNDAVYDYVKESHIPNVILVAYWEYYTDDIGTKLLSDGLISTVKKLVDAGVQPWIMLQVPHPNFDVPKGLAMASIFEVDLEPMLGVSEVWNGVYGEGDLFLDRIEAAGGHVLDIRRCFFSSEKSKILVEKNGKSLFADIHHLSATGAKSVLFPCLQREFDMAAMPAL